MSARPVSELLYDSEAALRLVDSAIEDIREPDSASECVDPARLQELKDMLAGANDPHGLIGVSQILARGHAEIVSALASLRESRGALERSLRVVVEMDEAALQGDARTAADLRGKLRLELFALVGHTQLQDITTQQLAHAAAVLTETQARLAELAAVGRR